MLSTFGHIVPTLLISFFGEWETWKHGVRHGPNNVYWNSICQQVVNVAYEVAQSFQGFPVLIRGRWIRDQEIRVWELGPDGLHFLTHAENKMRMQRFF